MDGVDRFDNDCSRYNLYRIKKSGGKVRCSF